ncbi:hypothetical protein ES703_97248 [subsurface metagenome]
MGRLYRGTCKICREEFAARSPSALLSKMSVHRWKKHENWMKRRIREGKAEAEENPSYQDLVSALQEGPRAALKVYGDFTERQYQRMKAMMDALETILPTEVVISWKAIEALHDFQKGL